MAVQDDQEMAEDGTVILRRSEHCVSRRDIDGDAIKVLYRLKNHGHEAYLVGGGVRDLLLGRHPKDFDIGTSAHPGEIRKLFRNSILIGRRFRLVHILFRNKVIEVSTFRREPERGEPHEEGGAVYQRRDNTFGTAQEDARRRDFTINGLFYDIGTFGVIDHVGGVEDLDKGLIRCIGDPDVRFCEDPVRMIRAARFASRLGFTIEKNTYRAILEHHAEIQKASPARLLEEVYKLFLFGSGQRAFRILHKTGLLRMLFPELAGHLDLKGRSGSMFWRHLAALDAGATSLAAPTPALLLGVLLYGPFRHSVDAHARERGTVNWDAAAQRILKPVTMRFGAPKRVSHRIVQMFLDQRRLQSRPGRRFPRRRFVGREGFLESLALYEIDLIARGKDMELLEQWKQLYEECRASESRNARSPERTGGGKPRKPKVRRRRRRPRRTGGNRSAAAGT